MPAAVNDFKLDPSHVPVLMGHFDWAARTAEERVEAIMKSYSSTVGASWTSAAATAALNVQIDENSPKWKKLMDIIEELRQGVYTAAGLQMDKVQEGASQIQQAAHAPGGGSAMATNYSTRL